MVELPILTMGNAFTTFKKLGEFDGTGGTVPIYGVEEIVLENQTKFEMKNPGTSSINVVHWQGEEPPVWNFNFEITAGIEPTPDRLRLTQYVMRMQSWAQSDAGAAKPGKRTVPAPVKLTLPPYFSCDGVIRRVQCACRGPWGGGGEPSTVAFSGEYLIVPGWTNDGLDIAQVDTLLTSKQIRKSLYMF